MAQDGAGIGTRTIRAGPNADEKIALTIAMSSKGHSARELRD